jgi:hypothetical protein
MDKRAFTLSYHMLMWIPKILFTILVIVMVFGFIQAYIVTSISVKEPESLLAMHRIHFSEKGFMYKEPETGRIYPGVIDDSKYLGNNALGKAFDYPATALAIRVEKEGTPIYLEEDKYLKEWQPLAAAGIEGPGSISHYGRIQKNPVKGKELQKTTMTVLVQNE